MRRLLVGVRAESDAELEETAYRWRCGRMADLGFADFYEALAVYQELDPASVRIPNRPAPSPRPKSDAATDAFLRLPAVLTERLAGKTPLARAVAGLASRAEAADVHFALVALANRALSADRVAPGDDEAVRGVLERVSATLDLAVEFLARGDREREVAAVRGVPLLTLHRLGASLTGKLRRLARALRHDHPFAKLRPAIALFEPEDAEVLASLSRLRPCFPRLLASPPAAGDRPFASLADLAAATRAVERAAAALDLIAGLGVRPAQLEPDALQAQARAAGRRTPAAIDPTIIDTGVARPHRAGCPVARSGRHVLRTACTATPSKTSRIGSTLKDNCLKLQHSPPRRFFVEQPERTVSRARIARSRSAGSPACSRSVPC